MLSTLFPGLAVGIITVSEKRSNSFYFESWQKTWMADKLSQTDRMYIHIYVEKSRGGEASWLRNARDVHILQEHHNLLLYIKYLAYFEVQQHHPCSRNKRVPFRLFPLLAGQIVFSHHDQEGPTNQQDRTVTGWGKIEQCSTITQWGKWHCLETDRLHR